MFTVKLAELNICIDNKYSYIEDMCSGYLTDEKADFLVSVTDEEIGAEDTGGGMPPQYLESLAVYRKVANKILEYGGFLMHGAVISVDGVGIAFCAQSGTGKTTHMGLWKQLLGDRCAIINGDKPLIRVIDNKVYAYGTPWAGKEGLQHNERTELKKVCFIERSESNEITSCEKKDALGPIMSQIFIPGESPLVFLTMDILDDFMRNADFYIIKCNMDISAAETAVKGLGLHI